MVCLVSAESPFFDKEAARELFELNREKLEDTRGFESYMTRWFFSIYERGRFIGCIFCYSMDGQDWVGGFARRKCHRACLAALNEVKRQFPELYAETKQKAAEFILKKAGFRKTEPAIWVYRQENKEK